LRRLQGDGRAQGEVHPRPLQAAAVGSGVQHGVHRREQPLRQLRDGRRAHRPARDAQEAGEVGGTVDGYTLVANRDVGRMQPLQCKERPRMKPRLFVGSSKEGLRFAYAVLQNLRDVAEVTVWNQGVFQLTATTLESLVETAKATDFAAFV